MRDDPSVVALVETAGRGDESAWNEVVRRYSPLVWSTCRRHRITGADADDVGANVWLRLVVNLRTIREPEALPGWLATTARRECLLLLRHRNREIPVDYQETAGHLEPESDAGLLMDERRIAVRDALARLPDRDRRLLSLLFADPPMPYAEISARLGVPIGALGPTRQRCLAKMRRHPAVAALLISDPHFVAA